MIDNLKYYFNINEMIKNLLFYLFIKIINKVRKYIEYYLKYLKNTMLRKKLFNEFDPINILLIPTYIITINFIIALLIYLERGFNALIIYNNKYNKYILYILG
ncbi:hypothetical protein QR685DRAFT_573040 [Neurospora intermedia]|uniref:YggT family protein n=1 Tax=Neurospora intermedia TaxID=5142 RepID=A0ABR3D7T1_NEUIN